MASQSDSPDSFDADLHGRDDGRQVIAMHAFDLPAAHEHAITDLAKALPGAELTPVEEETGFFDVRIEASDRESALQRVFDALARSGAEDHLVIAEHPDTPEHWRKRS